MYNVCIYGITTFYNLLRRHFAKLKFIPHLNNKPYFSQKLVIIMHTPPSHSPRKNKY